jgi:hypothetical protein
MGAVFYLRTDGEKFLLLDLGTFRRLFAPYSPAPDKKRSSANARKNSQNRKKQAARTGYLVV